MPQKEVLKLLPNKYRMAIYAIYGVLGVIIGAIQVGHAAAEMGQPTWLIVTLAVYAFLGGAFGYTATTHTGAEVEVRQGPPGPPGRDGKDLSTRAEIERLMEQNRNSGEV